MQSLIDEAITLAFVIYGIPFCIINNPFFISALKFLNPGYSIPLCEVLLGCLLDLEVAKVIYKVDKILEYISNLTIGLDKEIQKNHSKIISSVVLTILCGQSFFTDMQYLSDVLLPIKEAILAVEANHSTLADCYINLVKITVAIQNLSTNEYKRFYNKYIGLKFGTFPLIANYAEKLLQKMGKSKENITSEIISNIAETVFKKFEEETLTNNNEIEMLNSAKDLYPNKQDLDLVF
ncbi:56_t:CDS:2 [Racocetra fulgida]|uniref:56_t:CDS:1 n=1 Tax=Racocetra fulgida TaxID=60492 RepID=A0A9N9A8E9_9GLOM|nr:56_t:CDS:2 [Racocetra fulgida]